MTSSTSCSPESSPRRSTSVRICRRQAEWASPDGEGPLAAAERAAAEGRFQEALETFLAAVQNGRDEEKKASREAMLKIFAVLGEEDPLTQEYRRKLAAALF